MDFSVVGLPHYTIWHLYEPSIDDTRHMEEMEQEKKEKEEEEREMVERTKLIKEQFKDSKAEWEKDGAAVQDLLVKDHKAKADQHIKEEMEAWENAKASKPKPKVADTPVDGREMPKEKPQAQS